MNVAGSRMCSSSVVSPGCETRVCEQASRSSACNGFRDKSKGSVAGSGIEARLVGRSDSLGVLVHTGLNGDTGQSTGWSTSPLKSETSVHVSF